MFREPEQLSLLDKSVIRNLFRLLSACALCLNGGHLCLLFCCHRFPFSRIDAHKIINDFLVVIHLLGQMAST